MVETIYWGSGPLRGLFELNGFGLHYTLIENMYANGHGEALAPHRDIGTCSEGALALLCANVYTAIKAVGDYVDLIDSRFEHMGEEVEA